MLMDVTNSKRAQAALRDLLNQAPLGVYLVDAALLIREANPIAQRTFGDIPGGVIGRNFDQIIRVLWDDSYADEIVRILRHTLATGEPFVTAERAEVRRDLGITEVLRIRRLDRITLPDGFHGVVCYFREISEQVRARQAIAESERQFRQIDRLHAADRLDRPARRLHRLLQRALV
ncbi:MAG: PAS domain S-box protein [Gammaproteobacteria bacterium]|nr:PAS domain S-box protein [Gammaproteobacteria bacterium]